MSTDVLLYVAQNGAGDGQLEGDRSKWKPEAGRSVAAPGDRANYTTDITADSSHGPQLSRSSEVEASPVRPSCGLCGEEGSEVLGVLLPSPCRCAGTLLHRSCLEHRLHWAPDGAVCPSCRAAYPVRRHTKSLWYWFLGTETRKDAALLAANTVFSAVNVLVVVLAWIYALFEDRPNPWLSTPVLASLLFVVTLFWAAFSCFRFHILYEPLARWKKANTTLVLVLGDGVQRA